MDVTHQNYFLQHLQALSQSETIHTSEEIQDAFEGLKLLDANVKLEPEALKKLRRIPLKKPIYTSIRFLDPITVPAIRLHMQKAMAQSPGIHLFLRATRGPQVALDCLNQVMLPLPLLNIFTVMSRQLPALYKHSLEVALISTFLGILHRMEKEELVQLMSIGLSHDVGSMFLAPTLLDRGTPLTWSDWRQIYTHPSLGYDVLKEIKGLHPNVVIAVSQHHERIDGSGYPHGLADQDLGRLGRIAAAAEVVASVTRHKSKHYLTTVLNANAGKLDKALLDTLGEVIAGVSSDDFVVVSDNAATFQLVDAVSDAVTRWHMLDQRMRSHRDLDKVSSSLSAVERIINNSGLSTDSLAIADSLAFIKLSRQTADAFHEAKYQLGQVLHDVHRNKASYMAIEPPEVSQAFGRWVAETDRRLAEIEEPPEISGSKPVPFSNSMDRCPAEVDEHMEMAGAEAQWYYLKGGKKCGPITATVAIEYIQRGELRPDDLVWRTGLTYWCMVKDVPELFAWDTKNTE